MGLTTALRKQVNAVMLGEEGFLLETPETKRILRASVFGDHDDFVSAGLWHFGELLDSEVTTNFV